MALTTSDKWLLVIISSADYVEGRARLHKYGLLVHKKIQSIGEFYEDWQPNNYGVFSPSLARGLQTLQVHGYVDSIQVPSKSGKAVDRYKITEKGRTEIIDLLENQQDAIRKISQIVNYYFAKPLSAVLNDVYTLFPEFVTKSKILADVNRAKLMEEELFEQEINDWESNQSMRLSKQECRLLFEQEINDGESNQSNLTNLVTKKTAEHLYNDEDLREKLGKKIGLTDIPSLDMTAFDRLSGLLQDKIKSKEVDSVDIVRTIRGT